MSKFLRRMLARNRLNCLLLSVPLIICVHPPLFGQSAPPDSDETANLTYRSSGSEVRLVFFATDQHHRAVTDLQEDDFAVIDDERVIRRFRSFTHSVPLNLDVVVLIDASESVLPQLPKEVTNVLQLLSEWPWAP